MAGVGVIGKAHLPVHGALLAGALALSGSDAGAQPLQNWFDDPFFQLSSARPECPEPSGPRVSEAERQAQSHRRAEKGTTCWLAGEADCQRASAYAYDREIAATLQAAWREAEPVPGSTLWATVQGRVVYVEGCVAEPSQAVRIEAFVRGLPHVQQAIAIVTATPQSGTPYRTFAPRR